MIERLLRDLIEKRLYRNKAIIVVTISPEILILYLRKDYSAQNVGCGYTEKGADVELR